jgi:hypothetical protein
MSAFIVELDNHPGELARLTPTVEEPTISLIE